MCACVRACVSCMRALAQLSGEEEEEEEEPQCRRAAALRPHSIDRDAAAFGVCLARALHPHTGLLARWLAGSLARLLACALLVQAEPSDTNVGLVVLAALFAVCGALRARADDYRFETAFMRVSTHTRVADKGGRPRWCDGRGRRNTASALVVIGGGTGMACECHAPCSDSVCRVRACPPHPCALCCAPCLLQPENAHFADAVTQVRCVAPWRRLRVGACLPQTQHSSSQCPCCCCCCDSDLVELASLPVRVLRARGWWRRGGGQLLLLLLPPPSLPRACTAPRSRFYMPIVPWQSSDCVTQACACAAAFGRYDALAQSKARRQAKGSC